MPFHDQHIFDFESVFFFFQITFPHYRQFTCQYLKCYIYICIDFAPSQRKVFEKKPLLLLCLSSLSMSFYETSRHGQANAEVLEQDS